MKRVLIIATVIIAAAGMASAQSVVGSPHDLSSAGPGATTNVGRVCVFCHTPHQAAAAAGQDPLWNHTLNIVDTYGVYDSTTLDATPTDIGPAIAGSAAPSNLCMSCHDGTVAVHSLYNDPNELVGAITIASNGSNVNATGFMTGDPNVGTNLTDDHPINFTYDTALAGTDGGLYDPAVTPAVAALLNGGMVQCASCHDPHDNFIVPFLVTTNVASALCLTCHIK